MVEEFRIVCLTSPSLIFPQKFGDLNKMSMLGFVHEWDMATQIRMTRYFDEFSKCKVTLIYVYDFYDTVFWRIFKVKNSLALFET